MKALKGGWTDKPGLRPLPNFELMDSFKDQFNCKWCGRSFMIT